MDSFRLIVNKIASKRRTTDGAVRQRSDELNAREARLVARLVGSFLVGESAVGLFGPQVFYARHGRRKTVGGINFLDWQKN